MLTQMIIAQTDIEYFLQQLIETGEEGMFLHDFPVDAHGFSIAIRKDGSFLVTYESEASFDNAPSTELVQRVQRGQIPANLHSDYGP